MTHQPTPADPRTEAMIDRLAGESRPESAEARDNQTPAEKTIAEVWSLSQQRTLPLAPPMGERLQMLLHNTTANDRQGEIIPLDFQELDQIAAAGQEMPTDLPPDDGR